MSLQRAVDWQRAADDLWTTAIAEHRQAPPDAGFADRLRAFSVAATEQAKSMRYSAEQGLQFQPWEHARRPRQPPAELRRGSGRVGPEDLWDRFDGLFEAWSAAVEQSDLSVIAGTFEGLAAVTVELATAVDVMRGVVPGDPAALGQSAG
jgi:hypothetical protein